VSHIYKITYFGRPTNIQDRKCVPRYCPHCVLEVLLGPIVKIPTPLQKLRVPPLFLQPKLFFCCAKNFFCAVQKVLCLQNLRTLYLHRIIKNNYMHTLLVKVFNSSKFDNQRSAHVLNKPADESVPEFINWHKNYAKACGLKNGRCYIITVSKDTNDAGYDNFTIKNSLELGKLS